MAKNDATIALYRKTIEKSRQDFAMRQKSDLENALNESLKSFERQREEEEKEETHKAVRLSI